MKLSEELTWRGFVNQTTIKNISDLDEKNLTFYFGVDPSADSMTVGNLAAAMMVRTFMKHGHKAVLLVGGATGMIGDPDGKAQERDLLTLEQIEQNKLAISNQYYAVFQGMDFKVVDNYDWFKNIGYLEFLRDIGKHVPMRAMLGRDFVQSRLGEDGNGISYAEFSYSLIQGYDFLHLYRTHDVTLQLCGADQWGNSIAGVDLIRRVTGGEAHVYSTPLIINKVTGKKFGKSEDGAVWLDENKTSVYKFYQFWINVDDEGVSEYMKVYTDFDKNTVEQIMSEHENDRALRIAQRRLAYEATRLVHGEEKAKRAEEISINLFENNFAHWSASDFMSISDAIPYAVVKEGASLTETLVEAKLASSKTEARRFIEVGAVKVYGSNVEEQTVEQVGKKIAIDGFIVLTRGKKQKALVKIL